MATRAGEGRREDGKGEERGNEKGGIEQRRETQQAEIADEHK